MMQLVFIFYNKITKKVLQTGSLHFETCFFLVLQNKIEAPFLLVIKHLTLKRQLLFLALFHICKTRLTDR